MSDVICVAKLEGPGTLYNAIYRVELHGVSETTPTPCDAQAEVNAVTEAAAEIATAYERAHGIQRKECFVDVECLTPCFEQKPIEGARPITIELWAKIKKGSKYYRQGLDAQEKPIYFPVESLFEQTGEYCLRFNSNAYRLEDVNLFVRRHGKLWRLV